LSWTLAWAIEWNIVWPLLAGKGTIALAVFVVIIGLIGSGLTGAVFIKLWNSYRRE
jgi:hypothetical protein